MTRFRLNESHERVVDAAPTALEAGGQAQVDGMFDDRACQQGIQDLTQGIPTTAQSGINCLSKGAQALQGNCIHAGSMPKRAFLVYPSSPTPCCWLNGKFRARAYVA